MLFTPFNLVVKLRKCSEKEYFQLCVSRSRKVDSFTFIGVVSLICFIHIAGAWNQEGALIFTT